MATSLKWDVKGWYNLNQYLELATKSRWEIRYQSDSLLIVRIPNTFSQSESWHVLRRIATCTTGDWWLTIPRSRRVLNYALNDFVGIDLASAILTD
jgi:uncharacterized membrane protein YhhN